MHRHLISAAIAAAFSGIGLVTPGLAATFSVDLGTGSGTFDAPSGGGIITRFSALLGATVFDMLELGEGQPVYHPFLNLVTGLADADITGTTVNFAEVFNSMAAPGCGSGECVLLFFDTEGGDLPPQYVSFNTNTLDGLVIGTYAISPVPVPVPVPVPLPAAGLTLLARLGAMGAAGRRWRAGGKT